MIAVIYARTSIEKIGVADEQGSEARHAAHATACGKAAFALSVACGYVFAAAAAPSRQ